MPEKKERKQRHTYTTEFKKQIVELYLNGKRKCEIIREYELTDTVLGRGIYQAASSGLFHEKYNRISEQKELIQLRKENKKLLMENDILKQSALVMGRK